MQNGQLTPKLNVRRQRKVLSGLEGLLKIVGLEVSYWEWLQLVLYINELRSIPADSCSHRTCRLVAYKEYHLPVVYSLKVVLE